MERIQDIDMYIKRFIKPFFQIHKHSISILIFSHDLMNRIEPRHLSTDAQKLNFETCKSCYIDCFSKKSDVAEFVSVEDLMSWMRPIEDEKCSNSCASPELCYGFKSLLENYFSKDGSEQEQPEGYFLPSETFKQCMTKTIEHDFIKDALLKSQYKEVGSNNYKSWSFNEYFVSENDPAVKAFKAFQESKKRAEELAERERRLLAGGADNIEDEKYELAAYSLKKEVKEVIFSYLDEYKEKPYPQEGNNKCFQNLMNHVNATSISDDPEEQELFEICKPCYQQCFAMAADISTLGSLDDITEWVNPEESSCATGCDNRCAEASEIIPLMSQDTDNAVKECFTRGVNAPVLKLVAQKNDEFSHLFIEPEDMPELYSNLNEQDWFEYYKEKTLKRQEQEQLEAEAIAQAEEEAFEKLKEENPELAAQILKEKEESKIQYTAPLQFLSIKRKLEGEEAFANNTKSILDGLSGNNICFQGYMAQITPDMFSIPATQGYNWDVCQPCYIKCISLAVEITSITDVNTVSDFFITGEPTLGNTAFGASDSQNCTQTCEAPCHPWKNMWPMYLGSNKNFNSVSLHSDARKCMQVQKVDKPINEKLLEQGADKFFEKNNRCLIGAFSSVFRAKKRTEIDHSCFSCYSGCIGASKDIKDMHSLQELQDFLRPQQDHLCNTIHGRPCDKENRCKTWADLADTFFLRERFISEGVGEKIPISDFQNCLNREKSDALLEDLQKQENNQTVQNEWLGEKLRTKNLCMQDILKRVYAPDDLDLQRCLPCYLKCIGHNSKMLKQLNDLEQLQQWISPGPDTKHRITGDLMRCSRSCDPPVVRPKPTPAQNLNETIIEEVEEYVPQQCLPFSDLMAKYFYTEDNNPSPDFRKCLTNNVKFTLMQDALEKASYETYSGFFNEIISDKDHASEVVTTAVTIAPIIHHDEDFVDKTEEELEQVKLDMIEKLKNHDDSPLLSEHHDVTNVDEEESDLKSDKSDDNPEEEITVNNLCFLAEMLRMDLDKLQFEKSYDETMFALCQPCYEKCMAEKTPISEITELNDLMDWITPDEDSKDINCAKSCHIDCLDWHDMLKVYFNKPGAVTFQPYIPFRSCLTNEASADLVSQATDSTTFYMTFFKDNNECLKSEFNSLTPEIQYAETYNVCKPCYLRCIAEATDISKLTTFDELLAWTESKAQCLIHEKECGADCSDFEGMMKSYFFDISQGGHGDLKPNRHLQSCIGQVASDELKQNLKEQRPANYTVPENGEEDDSSPEALKIYETWIADASKDNNHCMQDILIGLDNYKHDSVFARCRSCYLDCISEKSEDLTNLKTAKDLEKWLVTGPDDFVIVETADITHVKYISMCSSGCNIPDGGNNTELAQDTVQHHRHHVIDTSPCLSWSDMVEQYFFKSKDHHAGSISTERHSHFSETSHPTFDFKTCLRDDTTDELKESVLRNFGINKWHNYFEIEEETQIIDHDGLADLFDVHDSDLNDQDLFNVTVTGRNQCLQKIMHKISYEDLKTDDQRKLFNMCKPCYVDCLRTATDFSKLNTVSDLINWISGAKNSNCASKCHGQCHKFDEILLLYFNKPHADGFQPHPAFRTCLTFSANNNLLEEARKSISFYQAYFIDKNTCLAVDFEHLKPSDGSDYSKFYDICKPCYKRCIAESEDIQQIDSYSEFQNWLNNPKICKFHDSPCHESCYNWKDLMLRFFFEEKEDDKGVSSIQPTNHLAHCMQRNAPSSLRDSLEEENFELALTYFGARPFDNNHCLQDVMNQMTKHDLDKYHGHSTDEDYDQEEHFLRCKPCYLHCISEQSKDLKQLKTFDEFQLWTDPGPDVITDNSTILESDAENYYIHKCSKDCDGQGLKPCFSFKNIVQNYFFETSHNGMFTKPSNKFKMCLKLETTAELQASVHKHENTNLNLFHGYFDLQDEDIISDSDTGGIGHH